MYGPARRLFASFRRCRGGVGRPSRGTFARRSGTGQHSSTVAPPFMAWAATEPPGRRRLQAEGAGASLQGALVGRAYRRPRLEDEHRALPITVVWDDSRREPAPQRVRCLEIRSGASSVGRSYGIILSCDGGNTSKRLGYFGVEHRKWGVPVEEMGPNWLRQEERKTVCIT